jgi:hypothetical protein
MNRVRTTALTALGFLGANGLADEPTWKAASLAPDVIVVVPRPGGNALPIPKAPTTAQPEVLDWGKPQGPPKVVAEPIPAKPAAVPAPPAPVPLAPPAFPVIISDFTQPSAAPPAPMVKAPDFPPEFRAVRVTTSEPEADVPPAQKMPQAEKPALVTVPQLPPEQPLQVPAPQLPPEKPGQVPVPKRPAAKEEWKTLPAPKEIKPAPAPLPPSVATPLSADCELEPVPGMFTSPYPNASRHGVYGSPGVRLSRDYAFRDGVGLDMEKPAHEAALVQDRWFVQTEFLMWWMNPARIPTLATTNTLGGPGILGNPGTQNLIGPGTIGPTFFNGFRVRAGGWLESDCDPIHGFDGSYFFLGQRGTTTTISGLPVISRPFTQAGNGQQAVEVVAQPGISVGRFVVSADSSLWGADLNYKQVICRECDRTSQWFAGYRTLTLQESLIMEEFIRSTGASPPLPDPPGTLIYVQDSFVTQNTFHGGQLGYASNRRNGRWDVDLRASAAVGFTHETVTINGYQLRTRPGQGTQSFQGGLLAIGSNSGVHTQNRFAVVPEATVNLGYAIRPNLRAYVGYNFLYWSNVVRPGDQIDPVLDVASVPNLNPNAVPSGQARPAPTFTQAGLFVQGVQLGLEWRW